MRQTRETLLKAKHKINSEWLQNYGFDSSLFLKIVYFPLVMQNPMIERDISWLSFNERVLHEAADHRVPLYERIKFLAIYSSNLDEFFRVRVASLRQLGKLKKKTRKEMTVKPKRILKQIHQIVEKQQACFGQIFREEILPGLKEAGIHLIDHLQFSQAQESFSETLFKEKIRPLLKPVWIGKNQPLLFLENNALYLIVTFHEKDLIGLVNIPSNILNRFVILPSDKTDIHYITYLDEIVRSQLTKIFPGVEPMGAYAVKISRDAEIYIDDEYEGDLLAKIKKGLDQRSTGIPTRFLYDVELPEEALHSIATILDLTESDLIPGARYHNFNDFFKFPNPTHRKDLTNMPLHPLTHHVLEGASSIIDVIEQRDYMLHFPYQSFRYIPYLILEATRRDDVKAVKITLYRVASNSAIVNALLEALARGKKVVAFMETKARFDEASNLYWGELLANKGATVLYSYPGIKVHSKLIFIVRNKKPDIAYLGTGNFNEKTAELYCDHALITSDKRLTNDVRQVFDLLEGRIIIPKSKHLLISPFTLREKFTALIRKFRKLASAGEPVRMLIKLNSLEDADIIRELYKAGRAGAEIRIIVRSICCLIPETPGLSENISAISILDRYLEHARIFLFQNGDQEIMYLASADWMTRNLDHRIEVAFPIFQADIFREIKEILEIQWADSTKARRIDPGQSNAYCYDPSNKQALSPQVAIYNYLKKNPPHQNSERESHPK